ncbi:hypothetical protein HHI36_008449 [Cryptolaemus montrouzieri]|uniref:Uncharacterized protein n=1 Tax=Cryptolaemus montrouzieri TaxID=559131 RepID=A0ABD2MSF3_9CUCU
MRMSPADRMFRLLMNLLIHRKYWNLRKFCRENLRVKLLIKVKLILMRMKYKIKKNGSLYLTRNVTLVQRQSCTGASATNKKPSFQGAVKKYWLYVERIAESDVFIEAIKDYLGDVGENIDVKKLDTKGSNSAFSIRVTSEDVFNTVSEDFWPEGVLIREFSFRNFFQKGSASRNPI